MELRDFNRYLGITNFCAGFFLWVVGFFTFDTFMVVVGILPFILGIDFINNNKKIILEVKNV